MDQADVTVVIVPREQFSVTQRSLESLYHSTKYPFALIYIDGGSPKHVATYLERQAREKGFRLIRTNTYLSPNQARNLALKHIDTRYVLFMDNDVLVAPGWLASLVRCAEETGAWLVGPTYCIGDPPFRTLHMAGGTAEIVDVGGRRDLEERHRFIGRPLDHVQPDLRREPTGLVEFHSMLVRSRVFEALGELDEELLSSAEHIDLCLAVRNMGGGIFIEPASLVTYLSPPPLAYSDLPYFTLRWSDAWNARSLSRFQRKWNLAADSTFVAEHFRWLKAHRRLVTCAPLQIRLRRLLGWRIGTWVGRSLLEPAETALQHTLAKRHANALAYR